MINGFQTPDEQLQAGIFGLGPNSSLNQWTGRDDVSYQPLWQLEALGIGNLARIKEQRGEQSAAIIELLQDAGPGGGGCDPVQGAAPVGGGPGRPGRSRPAHGHHHLQRQLRGAAADQPLRRRPGPDQPAAGSGLRTPALEAGLRRVLHARSPSTTGRSSSCSTRSATPPARSRTSGRPATCQPVDTSRPSYLPPVGNGPPPATR